jgi:hypothetical protein
LGVIISPSCLRLGGRSDEGFLDHVGDEKASLAEIQTTHRSPWTREPRLKLLPTAEEFAIDPAHLFQDFSDAGEIGQELLDRSSVFGGDVVHFGPTARVTGREIVLGAMTLPPGAGAAGLPAPLEACDEGTA